MILTPIQKLANNVGDLGKIIVATSFEWLPKVQKIAQSGHTGCSCRGKLLSHQQVALNSGLRVTRREELDK